MKPLRALLRKPNWIFVLTVLLPVLLAIGYYGLLASDVYISESRFVVRNPQRQLQSGLGALLQNTGFTRSQDDTYSVHDYMLSRDALAELDRQLGVRKAYSRADIDPINRFPGLEADDSFEALHRYYRRHVGVTYDTVSSITVLQVRSFTAEDAQRINELLLQMGERLVNHLNTRSRQDLIGVAEKEVSLAEERAKSAAVALAGFRARQSVFDPERQAALELQGVARLKEELFAAEAQLSQMRRLSPANPTIGALQDQVDGLKRALERERSQVTGDARSLSSKAASYDRLVLEKAFAERQLAAALTALESARSDANRKQLYLERLVQPNLADRAVEPRRLRSVFTVLLLGLVAWGVLSLLVASVREHLE